MSYWQNRRVTVTGGAGMVGAALVTQLLHAGAVVTVLDDFSRGTAYIGGATYLRADAGLLEPCVRAMAAAEVVFNLAARVAGVRYNQAHHAEMFHENMRLQTIPVLAAEQCHVPVFVQMSSVCVYGADANDPAIETTLGGDPIGANAGYSWAKRMGERVAQWSGIDRVVIVRPSNIYGPRDYVDERAHVIPALIRKCLEEATIEVYGSGDEEREFVYVDDVASGLLAAAERGHSESVYNIGTYGDSSTTIRALVGLIQATTETTEKPVTFLGGDGGDRSRWSSGVRARDDLDWHHQVDLVEGLHRTVEWYRSTR